MVVVDHAYLGALDNASAKDGERGCRVGVQPSTKGLVLTGPEGQGGLYGLSLLKRQSDHGGLPLHSLAVKILWA